MPASLCRPMAILRCVLAAALLIAAGERSSQAQPKGKTTLAPAARAGAARPAPAAATGTLCRNPPPCGSQVNCSNTPFIPTDCWTTQYWPAQNDVVVKASNMLRCNGGTYALCFFSGPPYATGKNSANQPLPCTVKGNIADCTCQAYTGPYFVDINGILNEGAYYQTVALCGQDGSGCANLANCGWDGQKSGCNPTQAPVCQYITNQNRKNPAGSLIPAADLISAFSFAMDPDYGQGSTCCAGKYAGCMTAPCAYGPNHVPPTRNGEHVQCQCPIADGNYQIGQSNQSCAIPQSGATSYAWSASFMVSPVSLPARPAPAGKKKP